jgi:Ca2+-transporting ATPase
VTVTRAIGVSRQARRRVVAMTGGGVNDAPAVFEWERLSGASLADVRTVAANAAASIERFYRLNCRSFARSMFQIGVFSDRWIAMGEGIMVAL